jgi:outer membrane receptor for ferrienterochelin and colicin
LLLLAGAPAVGAQEQSTEGPTAQQSGTSLTGFVLDGDGNPMSGALVRLFGPNRLQVGQADTDGEGRFRFDGLAAGRNYELRVTVPPFRDRVEFVRLVDGDNSITVNFAAQIEETVTISRSRGLVQDETKIAGTIRSLSLDVLQERAPDLLPRMLTEENGIVAQQTTPGQGSPILRGQSAQAVLYLLDGIRYNNSTYRAGNTQYLGWIPGAVVDGIDVQLGPSGVNYGSDALGGAIDVSTTQLPAFANAPRWQWHGSGRAFFESSSTGVGGEATVGGSTDRFAGAFTGTGGKHQEMRGGRGEDSHNVLIRFFDLQRSTVQDILGNRMVDTDYGSAGVTGKASYRVRESGSVTGFYLRNEQFDIRRYDRLLGGDGRHTAAFTPQVLDFGYARYQDVVASDVFIEATFSVNRQTDGREDQRFSDSTLRVEENAVTAYGYEFMASSNASDHLISVGAEVYDEYVNAFREEARDGDVTAVRARVPDGSRYTSMGIFVLDDWALLEDRMHLTGGVRFSYFRAATRAEDNVIDGVPVVPDTTESFSDVTFNVGTTYQVTDEASVYGRVARGFRAPSLFDFAETGLTGGGFEVAPREAADFNAFIGDSAGINATSTGLPWVDLAPELLWSLEAGIRWRDDLTRADLAFFDSELTDKISRRTMIVPDNVVGQTIGGQTVVAQDEVGRIFVAIDPDPVVSRANINRSRVWGVEWLLEREINQRMLFIFKGGVQRGRELDTGFWARKIAPDHFDAILRWNRTGGRLFLEGVFIGMLAQGRFNPADFEDTRIGGFRDADSIALYFNNGAVDLGVVQDGILLVTGETLEQVQQRVLGPDLEGNALFTEAPAWWTVSLRGGLNINTNNELTFSVNNIFDRNYRLHGSGFDSPGFSAIASWVGRF